MNEKKTYMKHRCTKWSFVLVLCAAIVQGIVLCLGVASSEAYTVVKQTKGDFVISAEETANFDAIKYNNSILVFGKGTAGNSYTIHTDSNGIAGRIVVNDGTEDNPVEITLDGVNIKTSTGPAIYIKGSSALNLKLADGSNNILKSYQSGYAAIQVVKDDNDVASVEISGNGKLNAECEYLGSGIGAGFLGGAGNITIKGGAITAKGDSDGAGIGGGQGGSGGNIKIEGGTVTAKSDGEGSGIGGGNGGDSGNISISGGDVTALSSSGAGIGGGNSGCGESITISGGKVKATSGYASGIGGGEHRECGTITIKGGEVNATSSYGAGIGGSQNDYTGSITIRKGKVIANGGMYSAGIGGGDGGAVPPITIKGGDITATGGIRGAGIGGGKDSGAGNITISSGQVIANGGSSAPGLGAGDGGNGGEIAITGGKVISTGGNQGAGIGGGQNEQPSLVLDPFADLIAAGQGYSRPIEVTGSISSTTNDLDPEIIQMNFADVKEPDTTIELRNGYWRSLREPLVYTVAGEDVTTLAFASPGLRRGSSYTLIATTKDGKEVNQQHDTEGRETIRFYAKDEAEKIIFDNVKDSNKWPLFAGYDYKEYAEGEKVTLSAKIESEGKVFDHWEVSEGDVTLEDSESASITFTMPPGKVSLKPIYEDEKYSLSSPSESGESYSYNTGTSARLWQNIKIKNTGNKAVTCSANEMTYFEVSPPDDGSTLEPGEWKYWKISARRDLPAGLYEETLIISGEKGASLSIPIKYTQNPALGVSLNPDFTVIEKGKTATITANATGGRGVYRYKWYRGNEQMPECTGSSIEVSPTESTVYKVIVEDNIDIKHATAVVCVVDAEEIVDPPVTTKSKQMLNLNVTAGSKSAKLRWNTVSGADGYYIYGGPCSRKMKKLKTVKESGNKRWTHKKLTNGKNYKYMVKAYKKNGSGTQIVKTSLVAHVATAGSKNTNARKITTGFTSGVLKMGETRQIKAKIVKENSKKKLLNHASRFRYSTNNSKVATVSKSGKIKAVGTGKCNVYVYANNGKSKKLTITVK